jgi:hypothetical protein
MAEIQIEYDRETGKFEVYVDGSPKAEFDLKELAEAWAKKRQDEEALDDFNYVGSRHHY